jgi:hypothetical protein
MRREFAQIWGGGGEKAYKVQSEKCKLGAAIANSRQGLRFREAASGRLENA